MTSGKGGVGKTTITAALGRSLASLGERTVVLDADIGLNNLDVVLGIDTRIVYDIVDVIEGRCRVRQALIEDIDQPGLYVLPSAQSGSSSRTCTATPASSNFSPLSLRGAGKMRTDSFQPGPLSQEWREGRTEM